MYYDPMQLAVAIIGLVVAVIIYICLKVTGEMWYGINWKRVFYEIRRAVCKLLLKLFNK